MADKGIIFSAPMVRALLDGRKTQTRRLLRNPEYYGCPTGDCPHERQSECDSAMAGLSAKEKGYAPGDRLYVREAWRTCSDLDAMNAREMAEGCADAGYARPWAPLRFEADATLLNWSHGMKQGRLRPGRYMPRWASRLTLTVTDVRVQRVAEISEADAKAEGAFQGPVQSDGSWSHGQSGDWRFLSATDSFRDLWNSLHTKPGETWADNPWIVAVSFTVAHGNIDKITNEGAGAANNRSGDIQR